MTKLSIMEAHSRKLKQLSQHMNNLVEAGHIEQIFDDLRQVNEIFKFNLKFNKEDYVDLTGPSGSLIKVIENCSHQCVIEALKTMHILTFVPPDASENNDCDKISAYPSEVTSSIQRLMLSILKKQCSLHAKFSQSEYMQVVTSCLGILYNLVVCSPKEVLGNMILNTSYSFAFYGMHVKEPESFEMGAVDICKMDYEARDSPKPYTNRNRRKRLKRKKALMLPLPTERRLVCSFSSELGTLRHRALPSSIIQPPVQSLSSLSLKPQWLKNKNESNNRLLNESLQFTEATGEGMIKDDKVSSAPVENSLTGFKSLGDTSVDGSVNLEVGHANQSSSSTIELNVRNTALHTINAVVDKSGLKNKFGFWPHLMCREPSLMNIILRDPSLSVRISALHVINTFLIDSQKFLSSATDEKESCSFTSLAGQIGASIRDLHRCLCLALLSEKKSRILVKILKTLELLLENTRYSNLKPGLLSKVVTHVKGFLHHKEPVLRANAFSVMVSFFMIKPQVPEMKTILTKYRTRATLPHTLSSDSDGQSSYEEEYPDDEESDVTGSSGSCSDEGKENETVVYWLVERCSRSMFSFRSELWGLGSQVQLQSLKVLSALLSEHFELMEDNISVIQRVISVGCQRIQEFKKSQGVNDQLNGGEKEGNPLFESNEIVEEHTLMLLGALLGSVKSHLENDKGSVQERPLHSQYVTSEKALQLWQWAMQEPLHFLLSCGNEDHCLQTHTRCDTEKINKKSAFVKFPLKLVIAGANVLTHLSSHVLSLINETALVSIFRTLQSLLRSGEPQICIAGLRIIGVVVKYEAVLDHLSFPGLFREAVDVCCGVLLLHESPTWTNNDRLVASWTMANIFSAVKSVSDSDKKDGINCFVERETLLRVLKASALGSEDKERIRPLAVRCLGHVIFNIPKPFMSDTEVEKAISDSVKILVDGCTTGNNMRVCWSSCEALGIIMKNRDLINRKVPWKSHVLLTLGSLVADFQHSIVRIKAASAISNLDQRAAFGSDFVAVWKYVLRGVENAQSINDLKMAQHTGDITHQLCVCISSLISVLRLDDLDVISESFLLHEDDVVALMQKALVDLPPEQTTRVLRAAKNIQKLTDSDALSTNQSLVLTRISNLFKDYF